MKDVNRKYTGFTIIELVITMGIFMIITSLVTINLLRAQHNASSSTTVTTLISDIKQQQVKAMTGDTEGRGTRDSYGIHFDTNRYVLFHGTYSETEISNFNVNLEGSLSFTGLTGDSNVIFSQGSGEKAGLNSIVLTDSITNSQKTITINTYGVITEVN
jgi:type II secretory pathway pseudopilin PulG